MKVEIWRKETKSLFGHIRGSRPKGKARES